MLSLNPKTMETPATSRNLQSHDLSQKKPAYFFFFLSRSCITKKHDCANVEYAQIRDLVSCPLFSLLRADILCSWRSSSPQRSKPTQLATLAVCILGLASNWSCAQQFKLASAGDECPWPLLNVPSIQPSRFSPVCECTIPQACCVWP